MLETVQEAIEAAEKVLPGEVAPPGETDPRWQAIMLIEDFVECAKYGVKSEVVYERKIQVLGKSVFAEMYSAQRGAPFKC